jgi:LmbE family N-acetylglucosaminyl deacetylase
MTYEWTEKLAIHALSWRRLFGISSRPRGGWEGTPMSKGDPALSVWLCAAAFTVCFGVLPGIAALEQAPAARKLKVVVFGGHPDDPESGAGGLVATLTGMGHDVILAYGTAFRADRQFFGRPEADVRREEASAACKVLGATAKFFPYAHEKLVADQATLREVSAWLEEAKPDIVVTHWPLDTHENHHAVSSLVWQCYQRKGAWNLYFFEVMTDQQTIGFKPELYLDIKTVREIKRLALAEHKSQEPAKIWAFHERMHRRRGAECGCEHAEAYSLVEAKPGCPLLPVMFRAKK